jgi:hypothetical protein
MKRTFQIYLSMEAWKGAFPGGGGVTMSFRSSCSSASPVWQILMQQPQYIATVYNPFTTTEELTVAHMHVCCCVQVAVVTGSAKGIGLAIAQVTTILWHPSSMRSRGH